VDTEQIKQTLLHKQRVVFIGQEAHETCILTILLLKHLLREIDYILISTPSILGNHMHLTNSPVVILEEDFKNLITSSKLKYEHHIGVFCKLDDLYSKNLEHIEQFIRSTPKGGILIYSENSKIEKKVFSKIKNLPDVKCVPYTNRRSITATRKNFIPLPDGQRLQCNDIITSNSVAATKTLLKFFAISERDYFEALLHSSLLLGKNNYSTLEIQTENDTETKKTHSIFRY